MPSTTFLHLPVDKRRGIIAALTKEFSSYPLSEAKVSRIVASADIPRGSFYVYFADLFDAYATAFSSALATVDAGLDQSIREHPDDTLQAVYAYTLRFANQLATSPLRDLYAMHWRVNRPYLAVHDTHIAHHMSHGEAQSMHIIVDGVAITDTDTEAAIGQTLMNESHAAIAATLDGADSAAAMRRFALVLNLLRQGVRLERRMETATDQGESHVSRNR